MIPGMRELGPATLTDPGFAVRWFAPTPGRILPDSPTIPEPVFPGAPAASGLIAPMGCGGELAATGEATVGGAFFGAAGFLLTASTTATIGYLA